jgi:hypothetical protein
MYEATISAELFQCRTAVAIDMSSLTTQRPSVISMLVFAWKRPECNHSFMDCLTGGAVVTDLHPTVLYTCCACCLSSCVADAVTVAAVVFAFVAFVEAVFYRVLFISIKT